MEAMKIIFATAITMAICITLTVKIISEVQEKTSSELLQTQYPATTMHEEENNKLVLLSPSKSGISRFLAEAKSPNQRSSSSSSSSSDSCSKKDRKACHRHSSHGKKSTCCSNKCVDLSTDANNCGKCKKNCKFPEACCGGKCVNLASDKKNCGKCNKRCKKGKNCGFGLCGYA